MTDPSALELAGLTGGHAICRLPPKAAIPAWAAGRFLSTTRTADELMATTKLVVSALFAWSFGSAGTLPDREGRVAREQ